MSFARFSIHHLTCHPIPRSRSDISIGSKLQCIIYRIFAQHTIKPTSYPPNVSHTTQSAIQIRKISIYLHALRLEPGNIVPESGSNATNAHAAIHIGATRITDAVNHHCGESPNRSVGRTVRTISSSIHATQIFHQTTETRRGSSDREANYDLNSQNLDRKSVV